MNSFIIYHNMDEKNKSIRYENGLIKIQYELELLINNKKKLIESYIFMLSNFKHKTKINALILNSKNKFFLKIWKELNEIEYNNKIIKNIDNEKRNKESLEGYKNIEKKEDYFSLNNVKNLVNFPNLNLDFSLNNESILGNDFDISEISFLKENQII